MIPDAAWLEYRQRLIGRAASFVGRDEAEDVVQDVICNYLVRVRRLPTITHPFLYLYGAVCNRSVSVIRRRGTTLPLYASDSVRANDYDDVDSRLDKDMEVRRLRQYPEWDWLMEYGRRPKSGLDRVQAHRKRMKLMLLPLGGRQ